MDEMSVQSWGGFESAISPYVEGAMWSNSWVFRGQADARWTLRPSLVRSIGPRFGNEWLRWAEMQATIHFAARVQNYQSVESAPYDNWLVWWPLMQHHGVPTRLLDWTKSIYVAAYFAVQNPDDRNTDGAIYVVDTQRIDSVNDGSQGREPQEIEFISRYLEESHIEKPLLKFLTPLRMTDRMSAQQGLYSVSQTVSHDHDEVINLLIPDSYDSALKKIIIPGDQKHDFARRLQRMNITAGSLFPGLDGLGQEVRELLIHEIATEEQRLQIRAELEDSDFRSMLDKYLEGWGVRVRSAYELGKTMGSSDRPEKDST